MSDEQPPANPQPPRQPPVQPQAGAPGPTQGFGSPAYPAYPTVPAAPVAQEKVVPGLAVAALASLLGIALTVGIWRAGFVAGITSFVLAALVVFTYTKVAGPPPRKGLIPLVVLIVLAVVASFFACVASDLNKAYSDLGGNLPISRTEFIRRGLTNHHVLSAYKGDAAKFAIFAVLGIAGTLSRMFRR